MSERIESMDHLRRRIEAEKTAAKLEAEDRVRAAQAANDLLVAVKQAEAEQHVTNGTIRRVLYTHNNVISSVEPARTLGGPSSHLKLFTQVGNIKRVTAENDLSMFRQRAQILAQLEVEERKLLAAYAKVRRLSNQIAVKWDDVKRNPFLLAPRAAEVAALEEDLEDAENDIDSFEPTVRDLEARARALSTGVEVTGEPINAAIGDLFLDAAERYVYWGRWADPFTLYRLDLQKDVGTGRSRSDLTPEQLGMSVLYHSRPGPVTSVALLETPDDPKGVPTLFWLEGNESLMSAPADGSGTPFPLLSIGAPDRGGLWQVAVDPVNRRLYWTNTLSIWRVDLRRDGSGWTCEDPVMVVSPSESPYPIDLAVDGVNRTLYWIDRDLGRLRCSDLDGIEARDLYPISRPFRGIDVDPVAGFVYWGDEVLGSRVIRRGSTPESALTFDGVADFVDLGRLGIEGSFTVAIELEIPPGAGGGRQWLLSANGASKSFGLSIQNGELHLGTGTSSHTLGDLSPGPQTVWVSLDSEAGASRATAILADGAHAEMDVSQRPVDLDHWLIGARGTITDPVGLFTGRIWSVRMWKGANTVAQMTSRRDDITDPTETSLVGWWSAGDQLSSVLPNRVPGSNAAYVRRARLTAQTGADSSANPASAPAISIDPNRHRLTFDLARLDLARGFTFETWVRVDRALTPVSLVEIEGEGQLVRIGLRFDTTRDDGSLQLEAFVSGGGSTLTAGGGRVPPDVWTHVAVSLRAGSEARLFVNGAEVSHRARNVVPRLEFVGPHVTFGGSHLDWDAWQSEEGPESGFSGAAAELRLWSGALGETPIQARRHRRLTTPNQELIGCWPLNDGAGMIVSPSAGVAGNGRIMLVDGSAYDHLYALQRESERLAREIEAAQRDEALVGRPLQAGVGAGSRVTELSAQLDATAQQIGQIEESLAGLPIWTRDELPIANVDRSGLRVSDFMEVAGMDGLAISFTSEFAAAQLSAAQTELRLAREQSAAAVASARQHAATKKAEIEARKAAEIAAAQADVAAAKTNAAEAKQRERQRKQLAQTQANSDTERAAGDATAKVDAARTTASETKSAAMDAKDARLAPVKKKRDDAKADLAAAKRKKANL